MLCQNAFWLLWGHDRGGDGSGHRQSQEEAAPDITPEVMAASLEGCRWGWGKVGGGQEAVGKRACSRSWGAEPGSEASSGGDRANTKAAFSSVPGHLFSPRLVAGMRSHHPIIMRNLCLPGAMLAPTTRQYVSHLGCEKETQPLPLRAHSLIKTVGR